MVRIVLMALTLFLSGCPSPTQQALAPMSGQVFFPTTYMTQATMADIATAATVSLIDTGVNQTVATSLTDSSGRFLLNFGSSFRPGSGVYVLEAVKGLSNNRASNVAARVRTLTQWSNGGWTSMTNSVPGAGITVNRSTTALSTIVSLRNLAGAPLIGTVAVGTPDSFADAGTGITQSEYSTVYGMITESLAGDRDPLENVAYNGTSYFLKNSNGPTLVAIYPNPGTAGSTVTLLGQNFSGTASDNTVTFNGAQAMVTDATPTRLTVLIPNAASTGPLNVVTSQGTASANYTVIPGFNGGFNF